MKLLCSVALICCFFSCSKEKEQKPVTCFLGEPAWLQQKKAEYASCTCLTKINEGMFNNQLVYEIQGYDPLCDAINLVYKADGTQLLSSADLPTYVDYRSKVKNVHTLWTCSK